MEFILAFQLPPAFFAPGGLWESLPEGDWASISSDGTKILAHDPDIEKVHAQAPVGLFIRKRSGMLTLQAMA